MTDIKTNPKCLCCGRGYPETYALAASGSLVACYSCMDLVADVMRGKHGPTHDPLDEAGAAHREASMVLQ